MPLAHSARAIIPPTWGATCVGYRALQSALRLMKWQGMQSHAQAGRMRLTACLPCAASLTERIAGERKALSGQAKDAFAVVCACWQENCQAFLQVSQSLASATKESCSAGGPSGTRISAEGGAAYILAVCILRLLNSLRAGMAAGLRGILHRGGRHGRQGPRWPAEPCQLCSSCCTWLLEQKEPRMHCNTLSKLPPRPCKPSQPTACLVRFGGLPWCGIDQDAGLLLESGATASALPAIKAVVTDGAQTQPQPGKHTAPCRWCTSLTLSHSHGACWLILPTCIIADLTRLPS